MTTSIFVIVLVAYVAVGLFVARRVRNSDDFFVMNEGASTLLIVGTLAATYLSAVTLLGVAGLAYTEGPLVLATTGSFGTWVGTLLAVVYIGRKLKSLGCRTLPDFFERRFQSPLVTTTATIIMIIGLLGYGVIQLIGAGLVIGEITSLPFPLVIVLFVIVLLIFSALGGMYGVVVTDTLMFFSMLAVAIVVAPWIIGAAGFESIRNLADSAPGYWTLAGTADRPISFTISQFLVWIIFMSCTPAIVSRVFPAKNDFVVLKAAAYGVFLASLLQIPVFIAASGMRVIDPGIEPADRVMIVAFLEHVPPVLGGLGLAALMAAIMSTASTLFVLAGFGLSRDLYENLRSQPISERHRMIASRVGQLVIGVIVIVIAIARPAAIYWMSIYAGAVFGVGWLPTIVAGLQWRRMNRHAAFASMLGGVTTFVVVSELTRLEIVTMPGFIDPLIVALVVAVGGLIVVALLTKPSPEEARYYALIESTAASKQTLEKTLAGPRPLETLRREYRGIVATTLSLLVLSGLVWSYFALNLAF
ncbi:MAG: sodium:solute symporter [Haliea sp.]|nr:sodium:solute symporter [Haliea sp.]|tara:strand:- start:8 stop:1600 length:1593 start_codon:yes stop_codon:yes gene_type:complete